MATETSGDPTAANPSATTSSSKGFCFRPSALSDVADKMWKKASADSNTTSTQNASLVSGTDTQPKAFNLPPLSSLSASGTNANSLFGTSTPSSPFIFGKNISRRVAHATTDKEGNNSVSAESKNDHGDTNTESKAFTDAGHPESNGAKGTHTKVSFDTLAATSTTTDTTADSNGATATKVTSETASGANEITAAALEAAAAAYEAAKTQTQKQPQLLAPEEVKTGEEGEVNVVQASAKLYVFDTAKQSWADRGLAIIRVNDRRIVTDEGDHIETRIVVRLQGSLRVIVNTKLWPDMLLERVSAKRLRMSGTVEDSVLTNHESEAPAISIYLISASQAADVDRIERALRDRLAHLKTIEQRPNSSIGKKRPPPTADEPSLSNDSEQGEPAAKKHELEEQGGK